MEFKKFLNEEKTPLQEYIENIYSDATAMFTDLSSSELEKVKAKAVKAIVKDIEEDISDIIGNAFQNYFN